MRLDGGAASAPELTGLEVQPSWGASGGSDGSRWGSSGSRPHEATYYISILRRHRGEGQRRRDPRSPAEEVWRREMGSVWRGGLASAPLPLWCSEALWVMGGERRAIPRLRLQHQLARLLAAWLSADPVSLRGRRLAPHLPWNETARTHICSRMNLFHRQHIHH